MQITTVNFLLFCGVVISVYHLLPRFWQNVWLLAASCYFYATWEWRYLVLLAVFTLVNYGLALRINRTGESVQRGWLWSAVAFNVAMLAGFNYLPVAVVSSGLGKPDALAILVPVGLSYMVVEMISYQVEVRQGRQQPARNLIDFALYLAYFPRLLAGPIERAGTFLGQLEQERKISEHAIVENLALILVGYVRKRGVADMLARIFPDELFTKPGQFTGPELAVWLVAYTFLLYNDFAGYTSIVRGISGLMGIKISPNFNVPIFSRSFTEFWNKWHITLSHWLRDYIYYPTSRAILRRSRGRRTVWSSLAPPVATMLVSGLWHGSLHTLAWGGLHGLYQIGEQLPVMLGRRATPPQKLALWRQTLRAVVIFGLVTLAWVPFASSLPNTVMFYGALFTFTNWVPTETPILLENWRLVVIVPIFVVDIAQARRGELFFLRWPWLARGMALAIGCLWLVFAAMVITAPVPFVYQGF